MRHHYELGILYIDMGRKEEARRALETGAALPSGRLSTARVSRRSGNSWRNGPPLTQRWRLRWRGQRSRRSRRARAGSDVEVALDLLRRRFFERLPLLDKFCILENDASFPLICLRRSSRSERIFPGLRFRQMQARKELSISS